MKNDPYYPVYHFTPTESWMNDPNGPIYYRGVYHLFYQFDPQIPDGKGGRVRSNRTWGHAVSDDLAHWKDWPVAVWPDTPYDSSGVFSGNTFVDDQGNLCGLYTGFISMIGSIWLWSSSDLEEWTLIKNIAPSLNRARYWELPYIIKLDEKYVLMVGSHRNPYWIGEFDYESLEFTPDDKDPKYVDMGTYYSFNINMVDDKGPGNSRRQLTHGWLTIPQTITDSVPWWQGAHTIPRVLSIDGDRLYQEPVPEIAVLRGKHWNVSDGNTEKKIGKIRDDVLELIASFFSYPESMGIDVEGDLENLKSLDVWEMKSIWDSR